MARKPNYDFEKRRKEQERKAKKEAKAQRKRDGIADEPAEIEPERQADGDEVDGTPAP